ncbi:MAG: hypothetical protein IT288_16420 [Bdellovibrionales bacterium]|nr:hypothetical protein [Bdellovibrionales bacterium]
MKRFIIASAVMLGVGVCLTVYPPQGGKHVTSDSEGQVPIVAVASNESARADGLANPAKDFRTNITHGDLHPVGHLRSDTEKLLSRLDESLEGTLHLSRLPGFSESSAVDRERTAEVMAFLRQSRSELRFEAKQEKDRIQSLTYLFEKLKGRIPTANSREIHDFLLEQVTSELSFSRVEVRQRKSLVGDSIEIVQTLAMLNPDEGLQILERMAGCAYARLLRQGFENGVLMSRLPSQEKKYWIQRIASR